MSLEERFWSKVNKQGPYPDPKKYPKLKTRCWLWTGSKTRDGYGNIAGRGKVERVHRLAFEWKYGKISEGKQVLHKCDTRACVRHLFLGTNLSNILDKCLKERQAKGRKHSIALLASKKFRNKICPSQKGELCVNAKLTNKQVLTIRKLYASKDYTQQDLGDMFGVTRSAISYIISYKTFVEVGK